MLCIHTALLILGFFLHKILLSNKLYVIYEVCTHTLQGPFKYRILLNCSNHTLLLFPLARSCCEQCFLRSGSLKMWHLLEHRGHVALPSLSLCWLVFSMFFKLPSSAMLMSVRFLHCASFQTYYHIPPFLSIFPNPKRTASPFCTPGLLPFPTSPPSQEGTCF